MESDLRNIAEAVLFTMGKSVDLSQLAAAMGVSKDTAEKTVLALQKEYDEEMRGIQIIRLNDRFQMCTRETYYENLIQVMKAPKKQTLTEIQQETLSIVAYKQPVTRLEIEKIRGVKSDHAISKLLEYDLIYEVGRLDAPGRPALFATTEEFLRRFGIGSKKDLPEVSAEKTAEFKLEAAREVNLDEPREEKAEDPQENVPDGAMKEMPDGD
ncbi:MAG: SMC-Scp complex subunit ScpB [Clostridium sp.]|jgi:segregation and condensation protein B|nr:SMC-Scp complex subunit ScpB [Clostridium sp.]MBQ4148211.1 SMC-Scp complex subunit ScpB [Clostridium sp.]MBQ5421688.1 SMC-Scp complex subunit ScpB [Clostridium sp.]